MTCTKKTLKRHFSVTAFLTFALYVLVIFHTSSPCKTGHLVSRQKLSQSTSRFIDEVRLAANISAKDPRGTIFTCVTPSFYYTKHFLYSYTGMGFNVIVYEAHRVHLNGENLPIHWCRVRLLANGYDIGPPPLLYSDADSRVNLTELKSWITPYLEYDGLIIMNGSRQRPDDMRTNWFVLPVPKGHRTMKVLRHWASHERDVGLQDQTVINELYPSCDESVGLLCRNYKKVGITSWHCASHKRYRASCMRDMIHLEEKIPQYQKSK